MTRYFTVDRVGTLRPGLLLDVVRHADVQPPELQAHLDGLFPTGVTTFGERYLLQAGSGATLTEPNIELIWDYVRRARFPQAPSRFQSVFATATVEEAQAFRATYGQTGAIWEVEASAAFRADMSLLSINNTILVVSYVAEVYWSQSTLPGRVPTWELLLSPPVRAVHRVD